MNPIRAALLVPAALLAGCDTFVSPPVACEDITINLDEKLTSRGGAACDFAVEQMVTVAHNPRVDLSKCEEDCGDVSSLSLVGSTVRVVGGSGAVFVCDGSGPVCQPNGYEIQTVIDENGALVYRLLVDLSGYAAPGPGGMATYERTLATEIYRPGNSCPVKLDISLECQLPIE